MYSLRHDARAVSRVKTRRSGVRLSTASLKVSEKVSEIARVSGPGKYRENAIRQACGVVTKPWNRDETSETADSVAGGK